MADDWENENLVLPSLARQLSIGKRLVERHIKEMASAWESLDDSPDSQFTPAERATFLGIWNEHRTILGYTLLAELPYRLREALRNEAELKRCDFDLLIVDEYQDLNACDLDVIRLLSEQYGCRVLGIGDDDQSIYSFRSAAPEGIRRFLTDYENANDYQLTVTVRCGRQIISWANHVIRQNTDRPANRADLSARKDNPEGEVALYSFPSNVGEAIGVAKLVERMMVEHKCHASDMLVLLRGDHNQGFSKPIKQALDKLEIPYADPRWVDALLAEVPNRMVLALIRLKVNQDDSLAWATILNFIKGVGDTFVDQLYGDAREERGTFAESVLVHHSADFKGFAKAPARKAVAMLDSVTAWLESVTVPEDTPQDGWTDWLRSLPPLPCGLSVSADLIDLLQAVEELVDDDVDLGSV